MFKKPLAHQSNATPLRSSARRQLVSSIFSQYPSLIPPSSSIENENGDGEGMNEKELGKMIVPEGVRSCTFETSQGVEGTFYLSPDGEALWMSFGRNSKEYIPTLSLLSLPLVPYPPLPTIEIHHPLPPPLLTGAPLFIPAVRNLEVQHYIPDVEEGGLVAFVSSPTNSREDVSYIGVGRIVANGGIKQAVKRRIELLNMDDHHYDQEREEGKFADILTIIGDHLWELGSKMKSSSFPLPIPTKALAPPPEQPHSRSTTPKLENLSLSDNHSSSSRTASRPASPIDSAGASNNGASLSSSEISTLLSISLLQALTASPPQSFPIPASLLYSAHVLPSRPAYIPKDKRDQVVIVKSDWKKLTKWMKEVSKEGLLKIKETKGEVVVTGFDPTHPALQNHAGFTTIAEEETKAAKKAAREVAAGTRTAEEGPGQAGRLQAPSAAKGKAKEIVIEEMWKPSGGAISFWEACGVDKSSYHPPQALKMYLDEYITSHSLLNNDHRHVMLDDELGKAVGFKKPEAGKMLSREEVLSKLRNGVSWCISVGGVIKKGSLEPILLTVKTRQGRKTITHITGLETFNIEIDNFAEELRKLCAGSASVQPLNGASPKLNLSEILVQGNQVKVIVEALIQRGIPRKWIKEGDESKKKK